MNRRAECRVSRTAVFAAKVLTRTLNAVPFVRFRIWDLYAQRDLDRIPNGNTPHVALERLLPEQTGFLKAVNPDLDDPACMIS